MDIADLEGRVTPSSECDLAAKWSRGPLGPQEGIKSPLAHHLCDRRTEAFAPDDALNQPKASQSVRAASAIARSAASTAPLIPKDAWIIPWLRFDVAAHDGEKSRAELNRHEFE